MRRDPAVYFSAVYSERFASRQSEFHQFSLHSVGQRHLAMFYFYEMENTVRGVKSGRRGESATEPLLDNWQTALGVKHTSLSIVPAARFRADRGVVNLRRAGSGYRPGELWRQRKIHTIQRL